MRRQMIRVLMLVVVVLGALAVPSAALRNESAIHSWVAFFSGVTRDVCELLPSPSDALEGSHDRLAEAALFGLHVGTKPFRRASPDARASPKQTTPRSRTRRDTEDAGASDEMIDTRAARYLIDSIDAARRWWAGEATSQPEKKQEKQRNALHPSTTPWEGHDALSSLHLRAAEEYAEFKRAHRDVNAYPSADTDAPRYTDGYFNSGEEDDIDAVAARSHRKLVSLLRWRRAQREHHEPPTLGPEHVPHYAKAVAQQARAKLERRAPPAAAATGAAQTARRTFGAQQAQDYVTTSLSYCQDGLVVIPSSVNFTCKNAAGVRVNLTAAQVALQPPEVRSTCVALSNRRACVCPRDSIQGRTVLGDVACYWRDVTCTVQSIDPPPCPATPVNDPYGIEKCVVIQRKAIFQFTANVTCRWKWPNPADYAFYGVTLVPEPPASELFLVLNTTNTSQPIIKNFTGYRIAPFGSARAIMDDVFIYPVEPASSVMPLTSVHPAVGQYSFYARPINFNLLSDRSLQQSVVLGDPEYIVGQITGDTPVTFAVDFSGVPDAFITANRAYVEVGLRGGRTVLNPNQVMGVQWTVDFSDLVDPPVKSRNPSNVRTIIIAVSVSVGVVAVLSAIAGFYIYRKRSNKAKDKEEDRMLEEMQ